MSMPTLLDVAKANGSDAAVGLIEENLNAAPEFALAYARSIKGYSYKTLVRTGLPTAGFRAANQGVTPSTSQYENRNVECFPLNPRWECDKAVADVHEDGPEAFIAMEASGQTLAALITLGKQMYYGAGTNGDAAGHPGLLQGYDAANMTVDATGTTASTGSSVWAVKFGPQYCGFVAGGNGEFKVEDVQTVRLLDGNNKPYTGYMSEMLAHIGFQVGNIKAAGRIKKLTADSGKGLTDDLISDLLAKFPVGMVPDYLFMSRRSLKQLQQSRTATNPTGAPAPFPVEAFGVPIKVTDSILDSEALTL